MDVVKHLLSKGADDYEDLLRFASKKQQFDIMKFALDKLRMEGFNLNSFVGRLILRSAIRNGHIKVIKFLIENGMVISRNDALYARDIEKLQVAKYLEDFL